jgi:tRNA A-37 threonylcarbamoyl transferase component Bud32
VRDHNGVPACTADIRERMERAGRVVCDHGPWTDVALAGLDLPPQGWKIHVSARPVTLLTTVERVLPLLLRTPCRFKFARTTEVMRELNSHHNRPGAVGKAVTVYPLPEDFADLAEKLAAELVGMEGPRVHSDRRVRPDAPVYYRHAPFAASYGCDDNGDFNLVVRDDQGRELPGAADGRYRAPAWLPDPLTGRRPEPGGEAAEPGPVLLGGRYTVPTAITRAATGGIYRGTDRVTGAAVVIKERRAHTGEEPDGSADARHRLRGEAAVLRRLEDVPGLPRVLDHFRHGADEFLVTTDVGPRDLRADVIGNGTYTVPGRDLGRLARDLLRLVDAVHGRGVLVRDLAPKNVVLAEDGTPSLVDFEISRAEGERQVHGWSPGYSSPAQERGEAACAEDDLYSLGATLFYAATGIDPPARSTRGVPDDGRARAALALLGESAPPAAGVVPALLSPDPEERAEAARRLRAGAAHPPPRTEPRYRVTPDRLPALVARALEQTRAAAHDLMAGRTGSPGGLPSPTNQYRGAAGVGMELLRHDEASRELARSLAYWTAGFLTLRPPPPGLQNGAAGTALFLATAARELEDPGLAEAVRPLARTAPELVEGADHTSGLAGIGLAQLQLWRLCGDDGRLDLARRCARRLLAPSPAAELRECPPDPREQDEVTSKLGFAHGAAGTAHFLLCLDAATGDPVAGAEAAACLEVLAEHVPGLVAAASEHTARPMAASFCQGLTGIGGVLLRAGALGGSAHLTGPALAAAGACRAHVPRVSVSGQCCGLAGIGEFLLDAAALSGRPEYHEAALEAAGAILVRSDGTPEAPVFLDHTCEPGGGWATGVAGVLAFLRRLEGGGARDWLGDGLLSDGV